MRSLRRIPEKKLGGRLFHGLFETASFIIELKGHGVRYGYDESVLMDRIAGFGFQAACYSPLDRRIFSLDPMCSPPDNRIYLRDSDWTKERVADHPGFRFRNRTL